VRSVYVVISCDTDPDREGFLDGIPSGRLTWRGPTEGIPAVKDLVRGVTDSAGREPVFTWLLRADEQIHRLEGDYAWFPKTHQPLLKSLEQGGDELGWHPHFWRRDGENGSWFQEIEDIDWQVDMLRHAHRELARALPTPPQSVRMGWTYHNNRTYQTLEELGIAADFSALPGFRTITGKPPTRSENLFDWYSTPQAPYRPSRADYRRPPRADESACRLLEVPTFVSTSLTWSLAGGLQMARKTGRPAQLWYAVRRPAYCINVTARPALFAPLVAELRKALRAPGTGPLVFETHFHPDELLPNKSRLYNLESVRANLLAVVRACDEAGTPLEFTRACRMPALWPN
jgi:hypothetical protein